MMRRRGPGIAGTMARTAVVVGTAKATANVVDRHMQPQQQAAPPPQQYDQYPPQEPQVVYVQAPQVEAPAAPQMTSGGISQEQMAQLQQLAQLKDQGILTQEEFDRQKAKILG